MKHADEIPMPTIKHYFLPLEQIKWPIIYENNINDSNDNSNDNNSNIVNNVNNDYSYSDDYDNNNDDTGSNSNNDSHSNNNHWTEWAIHRFQFYWGHFLMRKDALSFPDYRNIKEIYVKVTSSM